MIKKLIHAFNPFNGTPFKTALLLMVVSIVFCAIAYGSNSYTLKEVNGKEIPSSPAATAPCEPAEVN